jgi:integrase
MKAGREHRVPLSPAAVLILNQMRARRSNETDLVFPGAKRGRPISDMAFSMLYRRLETRVSTHGFRTSFRTWAAERTDFPREVAEAALAHLFAGPVERAYQRTDFFQKRRGLMDAWAAYCGGDAGGNVVALAWAGS